MKYYWETFLTKLIKDGADLSELHPPGLLKAFYAYLVEKCFLGTPEDMKQLRKTLKKHEKTLKRGKSMYAELRGSFRRIRRLSRRALAEIVAIDLKNKHWWSENPDMDSPHGICVSRDVIERMIEARRLLDIATSETGKGYKCKR